MSQGVLSACGRVQRVEEKESAAGNTYAVITVPVDSGYGENQKTTWWNVKVHGKQAEYATTLNKGDIIFFYGEVEVRAYISNKTGEARVAAEVPFARVTCVKRDGEKETEPWDE